MSIDPDPWPGGYDRVILDETDSTNAEAARRAPSLTRPTWIMAKHQTAARGRRGRAWAFPKGNFAATLVLKPDTSPAQAALNSYVISLSLYMALWDRDVADAGKYSLKWPNDVLLNGGKVAGILLEASGVGKSLDWLAIGVGVNLQAAPTPDQVEQRALPPVSVLGETGITVDPEELLLWLAVHYDIYTRILIPKTGFEGVRRLWLKHAARLGEEITARTGREEITGIFETVDASGHLILRTAAGTRAIAAADVYF